MKRISTMVVAAAMVFSLGACAGAEQKADTEAQEKAEAQEQVETQAETEAQAEGQTSTPYADWNLPESIGMTEEVKAVFDKAMESLIGVNYEPVGYLGEKDGVYCVLCRATVVSPDAKPYYALVYVNDAGVQNIWDVWMGAHAEKKAE